MIVILGLVVLVAALIAGVAACWPMAVTPMW